MEGVDAGVLRGRVEDLLELEFVRLLDLLVIPAVHLPIDIVDARLNRRQLAFGFGSDLSGHTVGEHVDEHLAQDRIGKLVVLHVVATDLPPSHVSK